MVCKDILKKSRDKWFVDFTQAEKKMLYIVTLSGIFLTENDCYYQYYQ